MSALLPRAKVGEVLRGRAPVVGSRLDPAARRGLVSPVEARLALGLAYGDLQADEARYLAAHTVRQDAGVLVRAGLARLLAPRAGARTEPRPFIVSARVDNVAIAEAVEALLAPAPEGRARLVHFVHPHALNLARFDRQLAAHLAQADLVLPDGVGLRVAAAILGVALRHNINGTDLLPVLCGEAAGRGTPLALVGGAPGVAQACADNLVGAHPGLQIARVSDGFLDAAQSARLAEELARIPGAIVLVGMGTPLQERWAREHLAAKAGLTVVTVGGLFDFYSGRIQRAPLVWRELGLEWAWRLRQEPRRMARRYLLGNPLFLSLAAAQRLRGEGR